MDFPEAVAALLRGDFTASARLFVTPPGGRAQVLVWLDEGRFDDRPEALAEAFTCACFDEHTEVVEEMLARGVSPDGGMGTGMSAFHWAANRGRLDTVRRLIRAKASLETLNRFGGTVLSCTLWSALHEPRPAHAEIVAELLRAGAKLDESWHPPIAHAGVDEVLRRHLNR